MTEEIDGRESVFWGPIRSESKAQRVIDWASRLHLAVAGFFLAALIRSLIMNGVDADELIDSAFVVLPFGVPALWLMLKRSRIAAALLLVVDVLALILTVFVVLDSIDAAEAGLVSPLIGLALVIFGWLAIRAFRAAGVWQRVQKQTRKVSETFD